MRVVSSSNGLAAKVMARVSAVSPPMGSSCCQMGLALSASGGDCESAYDCCASVSDGTRACLKDPYCAENVDTKAQCNDVPGGSTYFGHCDGDVL